jgi:hypothetical protein
MNVREIYDHELFCLVVRSLDPSTQLVIPVRDDGIIKSVQRDVKWSNHEVFDDVWRVDEYYIHDGFVFRLMSLLAFFSDQMVYVNLKQFLPEKLKKYAYKVTFLKETAIDSSHLSMLEERGAISSRIVLDPEWIIKEYENDV